MKLKLLLLGSIVISNAYAATEYAQYSYGAEAQTDYGNSENYDPYNKQGSPVTKKRKLNPVYNTQINPEDPYGQPEMQYNLEGSYGQPSEQMGREAPNGQDPLAQNQAIIELLTKIAEDNELIKTKLGIIDPSAPGAAAVAPTVAQPSVEKPSNLTDYLIAPDSIGIAKTILEDNQKNNVKAVYTDPKTVIGYINEAKELFIYDMNGDFKKYEVVNLGKLDINNEIRRPYGKTPVKFYYKIKNNGTVSRMNASEELKSAPLNWDDVTVMQHTDLGALVTMDKIKPAQ